MGSQIKPGFACAVCVLALLTAALPGAALAAPGALDPSFGTGGVVTTDFGGSDSAQAVAIQGDGKIIAAGSSGAGDFALARYNTDGSLDSAFGSSGTLTTDFGGFDGASAVAIQSDGRIIAAGHGGAGDLALARYTAGGPSIPRSEPGGRC